MVDVNSVYIIGLLIVGLAGVAHAANQIMAFVDRWKEKPPPAQTYATKTECAARHLSTEQRIDKIEAELNVVRKEIQIGWEKMNQLDEQRYIALHNRINPMESSMEANTKVLDLLNQRLEHLDNKLDRILTNSKS